MGRLLADMGARVIKIESRARMDTVRTLHPFPSDMEPGPNRSGYYNWLNRNKLGVTLNLKTTRGAELAMDIIGISDAMMENYSVGVMKKFGLDYESVRKVKPDIIYASLSPLGTDGPYKEYVMYGRPQVYMSGLAQITGYPDQAPNSTNVSWGDPIAGCHGAFAVLSALRYRSKTGKGQYIELSQWEGLIGMIPEAIMDYTLNKRIRKRAGNRHEFMAPHNMYRCKGDMQWVSIAVGSEEEWSGLCEAMGHPEWTTDEMFSDMLSRWQNREKLDPRIEAWTMSHTPVQVTDMLQQKGVAAFPCLSNRGLALDPHLKARGFFQEWDHPEIGRRTYDGVLWKMSKTPGKIRRHAPLVGQHNHFVFGELLGMPKNEIDQLEKEKVIY
jgi:crotonobetainyl-CoA:carnitine CoA-transferase CaiB-like acyl-CoA transferase